MDPIIFVVLIPTITLIVALLFETRQYRKLQKEIAGYTEIGGQFIAAFETVKGTVNFNADIQRETITKINDHSRTLAAMMAVMDIHDRALNLNLEKTYRENEEILSPKKYGE